MFCSNCGAEINDKAVICVKCGCPIEGRRIDIKNENAGDKDWTTTLLLAIFLGTIGIHRFYTGHTAIGLIQLFTLGGCGIWTIIDIIYILTDKYTDAEGKALRK